MPPPARAPLSPREDPIVPMGNPTPRRISFDRGVTVPGTSAALVRELAVGRVEGVRTMSEGPSLEDRCLRLPSIRDLAWVAAHFGHR
jgi:hypothetical protein